MLDKRGGWTTNFSRDKKGQITLFIVVAIVLLTAISAVLLIKTKASENKPTYKSSENPEEYISGCITESFRRRITPILEHGGTKNPQLFTTHNDTNISYLCYTILSYTPCINQEPLLIKKVEREIKNDLANDVEECFTSMEKDYREKNIDVNAGETNNLKVELIDKKAIITFDKEIIISDRGESRSFKNFRIAINSPSYNLARVAIEMVSQEATFCHAEYIGYELLYPWVKIVRFDINSDHRIYRLIDKNTGERINFAIRGCAIPPGT